MRRALALALSLSFFAVGPALANRCPREMAAIDKAIRTDRRIKLVARGTGPDPCAFCAMLASRGFVYTGKSSGVGDSEDGSVGEEIEKFHVNCHCYPIVRFVNTSDTLPPLNAYFQEKWYEVTANYSGHDAAKAFRRWIYAQRKANPTSPHGGIH